MTRTEPPAVGKALPKRVGRATLLARPSVVHPSAGSGGCVCGDRAPGPVKPWEQYRHAAPVLAILLAECHGQVIF